MDRLVVVGGDAAGMSAASQARRRRGADDLEIVAFERGHFTSFSACGIPYWVGGHVGDRDDLIARTPETFRERYQIDVRLRSEVVGVDVHTGTVEVWDHVQGAASTHGYDELMIATGARPIRPPLPGIDAEGVFGVQTLDDGEAIRQFLDYEDVRCAVVVGGGYIGLEMAEAMVERGIDVRLLTRGAQVMPTLDRDVAEAVVAAMRKIGIVVDIEHEALGFDVDERGRVRGVATEAGTIAADLVFLGIGAAPEVTLAEAAGLPIGQAGGMVTDPRQHTPVDRVWAAGDCTELFHRVTKGPATIALGTVANKQGRVAGINLGGGHATFPGALGTAITRLCGLEIGRTGLSETQARAVGLPVDAVTIRSTTVAGYLPEAEPMTVKTTFDPGDGRLLGAQIVGGDGAGKRIDTFATALWNDMTVGDLVNVDLAYAPPFSSVWDPVLIAARKAWQQLP